SDVNAMTERETAAAPAGPSASAGIALGRSECEVARYTGRPDNVEISNDPRGDRTTVLTYVKGPRPGVYRFVAGRLSSVERAPIFAMMPLMRAISASASATLRESGLRSRSSGVAGCAFEPRAEGRSRRSLAAATGLSRTFSTSRR